jgi:hypothetical protein
MADKINKSDLFGDLNLAAEIAALKELLGVVTDLQKEVQKMAKTKLTDVAKIDASTVSGMKKLMQAKEDVNKIEEKSNELDKEAIKLKKQLKESEDEQVKAKIRYQEASKAQKAALRDELILSDKQAGTLQKLAAQSRKLRREREGLNLETKKGQDRLKEINKQLDLNNKRIISNSDALKKQRLNVGNYTQSVTEGIQASGLFSRQLMMLQRIQATLAVFTKRSAKATEEAAAANTAASASTGKFSKALRILRVALISTGIGAIVVAVGALTAAFASTQRGVDAFTKVLRPLKALFDTFIGFIQDTAIATFDKLQFALSNPKEAIIALGEAIKENLINRFKALAVFGDGLAQIFSGDLAEGFKTLGNAVIQFNTGVTNGIDKIQENAEGVGEGVSEAIRQGELLDDLIKRFEKRQIETVIPLAEARLEFQKLKELANDQTASDEERIAALELAADKQRFIAATEKELIDLRIQAMELEQSFNDTSREEQLELQQLKAEALKADEAAQKKIASLTSLRTGIELRAENKLAAEKKKNDKEEEKRKDKAKKDAEELADARIEANQRVFSEAKQVFDQQLDYRQEVLDTELQDSKDQEDQLIQLAQNRVLFAEESLAAEKAKQAEIQKELQKTENKKQLLKATETALELLGSYAAGGSKTPFRDALGDITKMLGAIQSIQFFADGTESVQGGVEGKDSVPAMLMPKERVVDVANNLKIGGMSNDQLADLAFKYRTGRLMDDIPAIKVEEKRFESNKELIKRVKDVETAIKNIPETSIDVHALSNFITETIRRQNKVDRKHYKSNEIFK